MYAYIIGTIEDKGSGYIILENNGIGYEIATSEVSMSHFLVGETYKVYTQMSIREDGVSIYGFYSTAEREIFQLLTKVTSIGPRSAMQILSALTLDDFIHAVLEGDLATLTRAPGVGKKTAGRIVLELSDPLKKRGYVAGEPSERSQETPGKSFALEALVNLGFPRNQALSALDFPGSEDLSIEELIKKALQKLS